MIKTQYHNSEINLPPSNLEIEETVLGGVLFDPGAITRIADNLVPEAFYVPSHQTIFRACLEMHKQAQPVTLLTVISWLDDHNLLLKIGGRNKLASLIDSVSSTVNIDHLADILVEKFVRRRLISFNTELEYAAHEKSNPLSWTLEKLEKQFLDITQLRKAKRNYWQKVDDIAFEQLCKELEEIEDLENAAQRDWAMRKLARKWKFSNKKDLLDFHAKWLDSQEQFSSTSAEEYFMKNGNGDQEWIIPGFIPAKSVSVIYSDGGGGKTRLSFSLAKQACLGGKFGYDGVQFDPVNVLMIETDQGPNVTCKLLEMQDMLTPPINERFFICDQWSMGEFGKLRAMLRKHKPKLIIIDSLTSVSTDSLYSEKDTEYARPLVRLRHICKEFDCSFLVLHHSNAQGGMRGSRAIRNTVDEVYKLSREQTPTGEYNLLTIDKTRSRGPGAYRFQYDDECWGWEFVGPADGLLFENSTVETTFTRILKFFYARPGIPMEAQEVAYELGVNKDTVRRELSRASREGLINVGRSRRDARALVYYVGSRGSIINSIHPEMLSNVKSDHQNADHHRSDHQSDHQIRSHLNDCPARGVSIGDQTDHENTEKKVVDENQILNFGDHFDHQSTNGIQGKGANVIKEVIKPPPTGDQFDHQITNVGHIEVSELLAKSSKNQPHPSFEKNETNTLKIKGMTGTWDTKYNFGSKYIHLKYTSPDGREGRQSEFIEWTERLTLQQFRQQVESAIWELERGIIGDLTFRVQVIAVKDGEECLKWIGGCKLINVPCYPGNTMFQFESPDGRIIRKSGIEEFELMEE